MQEVHSSLLSQLNDKQQEAVTSEAKRLLVLAGAGSGKTKTLLQKIIYLIEEKRANSNSILGITFTKNAANEMIDRLIISADDSGEYKKILSDKTSTKSKLIRKEHFSLKNSTGSIISLLKLSIAYAIASLENMGLVNLTINFD